MLLALLFPCPEERDVEAADEGHCSVDVMPPAVTCAAWPPMSAFTTTFWSNDSLQASDWSKVTVKLADWPWPSESPLHLLPVEHDKLGSPPPSPLSAFLFS